MSAGKDGGPAFAAGAVSKWQHGMSLRDWFAGEAMKGYLSTNFEGCAGDDKKLAHWSYQMADAMLAERAQSGGAK